MQPFGSATPVVEVLVFDILGTMVDERSGLRAALATALPTASAPQLDGLLTQWTGRIETAQRQIVAGARSFAATDVLNHETAVAVLTAAGSGDSALARRLAAGATELPAWPDSIAGLERLARRFPLIGLSNASRRDLVRINAYAGLRWHLALSVEPARTYKPAAAVYGLAIEAAGVAPERMMMVAAHSWDLRGAQAAGLRTAYVARPGGDPPTTDDNFDLVAESLEDLADQLGVA